MTDRDTVPYELDQLNIDCQQVMLTVRSRSDVLALLHSEEDECVVSAEQFIDNNGEAFLDSKLSYVPTNEQFRSHFTSEITFELNSDAHKGLAKNFKNHLLLNLDASSAILLHSVDQELMVRANFNNVRVVVGFSRDKSGRAVLEAFFDTNTDQDIEDWINFEDVLRAFAAMHDFCISADPEDTSKLRKLFDITIDRASPSEATYELYENLIAYEALCKRMYVEGEYLSIDFDSINFDVLAKLYDRVIDHNQLFNITSALILSARKLKSDGHKKLTYTHLTSILKIALTTGETSYNNNY